MHALAFLSGNELFVWEVSVWERARLVSGVGLVTIDLYSTSTHEAVRSQQLQTLVIDSTTASAIAHRPQAECRKERECCCSVPWWYCTAALLVADQRTTHSETGLCPGKNGS